MVQPVTREEQYLFAISEGTTSEMEPITRKERYLARAAGQNVEVPEPITREEMYLQKVALGGASGGVNKLNQVACKTVEEITAEDLRGATAIDNYFFRLCTKLKSVVIPNSVTEIGTLAFSGSVSNPMKIESVLFESNSKLQRVGQNVFQYNDSLTSIILPESVTSIDYNAFANCNGFVKFNNLPQSLKTINAPFQGCANLEEVTFPKNVTNIGSAPFASTKIKRIIMKPTTPPTIATNFLFGASPLPTIVVPVGTIDVYKSATNWSAYADQMIEGDE
jgi:hypothetical protein